MSAPLNKTLETIAAKFAQDIIQALRGASIDDLTSVTGGRSIERATLAKRATKGAVGGRLGRRSASDIQRTLGQIVTLLGSSPEGLRAEQIKEALGLDKREMPRPIAEGLNSGVLAKSGQKRATVYTVVSGGGVTKRATKKAASKK